MSTHTCPLCRQKVDSSQLRKSHFMPAALYRGGTGSPTYGTRTATSVLAQEVRELLLCSSCEQLLEQNGESEVLRWIAPKKRRSFPLSDVLRVALPRECSPDLDRFSGDDLGIDMDKFAYFALSVVWRSAIHNWLMPDGVVHPRMEIGGFEPPIREYLFRKAGFPPDTAVIVIVCNDAEARRVWTTPIVNVEANCLNFRFLTRGVFFRVMMGYRMPSYFRDQCCTSPRKCLFYGSAAHRMPEILQIFDSAG